MDTFKCNYHMHSTYSDGTLSPAKLVKKSVDMEYDVIALTDIGTIEGIKEFMAACEAAEITGVTGVEFITKNELQGKEFTVNILGLKFDPDNTELIEALSEGTEGISTEKAIELINRAGGISSLADPAGIPDMGERGSDEFWNDLDALTRDLKKKGLKAMECIYPSNSEEEEYRLIQLAGKYHLHITSGTGVLEADMK